MQATHTLNVIRHVQDDVIFACQVAPVFTGHLERKKQKQKKLPLSLVGNDLERSASLPPMNFEPSQSAGLPSSKRLL